MVKLFVISYFSFNGGKDLTILICSPVCKLKNLYLRKTVCTKIAHYIIGDGLTAARRSVANNGREGGKSKRERGREDGHIMRKSWPTFLIESRDTGLRAPRAEMTARPANN
jgi:hypothetical protein